LAFLVLVGPALSLTRAVGNAQDRLFGADKITAVEIEVTQAGFRKLQNEPRTYLPAVVHVDGQAFQGAEVHLKGHGSFEPITAKPNFMVRLDQGAVGKQTFGHKRLLLDNSSQDSSFIRWKLASELFMNAGLPAARVNFARVKLNGRDLGLYVLVEPTDKAFLSRHFGLGTGNLYEGSNTDVEDKLEQQSGAPDPEQRDLQALASASREADLQQRWDRLEATLDVNRFASFVALEVLICHHDGYSLDRNNFRIYHDPKTDRMVFIPHGMDLIFDRADCLPSRGRWRGTVARGFMETAQGRQLYRLRVAELAKMVYGSDQLEKRITSLAAFFREHAAQVGPAQGELEPHIAELERIVQTRKAFVLGQANRLSHD
jgi:spore coat protein H